MQFLLPFTVAMLVTMAVLPVLVRLAGKWLFVDQPGARKVHTLPIPRVGGLAMIAGVLIAAALGIQLQGWARWFLIGAFVLAIFGALDDRFNLDYRIKLIGQILAVSIVVILGDVQIQSISLDDRISLSAWISLPVTMVFLVGVTNAINLADGLDGLAGGTTFLCLCAIALLSSHSDAGTATALALTFAGAILGFLRFNTYPASVFMGDAGSQLLGFATGVLSVRITQNPATQVSAAIPILLLALPILDTASVMVQRISEGRSPFSADKNHIHHKLLGLGFGQHEAVMLIYVVQAALFVVAYFMRFESDLRILAVVTTFFVCSIAALQVATRGGWRLRRAKREDDHTATVAFSVRGILRSQWLPRVSYVALSVGLGIYAILTIVDTTGLSDDIRTLLALLLAGIVLVLGIKRVAPLSLFEKGALYVTATVLVYLEAVVLPETRLECIVSWTAVGVAAVATAIRLRLFNDRRFELTSLDVIVLFMALVVPNLPGTLGLPQGGALAIAKLVVVFYAIEMLITRTEKAAVWLRIATASVLAGLILRSFTVV